MIDDAFVLRVERLRDEAEQLKTELRHRLKPATRQVTAPDLRKRATDIAERWLVEIAARPDISAILGGTELAERNVYFQRLLTCAERASQRKQYDRALDGLLKDFRGSIIVPLKARRGEQPPTTALPPSVRLRDARMVFVGKSFADADAPVSDSIESLLRALGVIVVTGEKPKADSVSKKVKQRIDRCDVFLGVFTRKDKLEGKDEWATSPWVVDEKAYALARNLKLVLVREEGVASIGGLQGDYEYLLFDRTKLERLMISLVETFISDD